MRKILLFAALAITGPFSFAQDGKVINDKNAQKRTVTGFHAIQVSGGIDLYLSQGNEETVVVSASDLSDRDRMKTEVVDGVLKIYMEQEGIHWGSWIDRKRVAYVAVRDLDGLKASGGSDVYIEDMVKTSKLDLRLSGGSDLKGKGKVDIGELSIVQSGGSDIYISGTASSLSVHASGGSDLHGYDLLTDNCHVEASGGSDIHITANKELTVSAGGGSDVYYKGSAVIRDLHSGGSSSVTRKE
jgi:Putative auto-transporter adhesin, head GIN domain